MRPHRLYSPRNSPGQNTGVGSLSFFRRIFPTQGSNPGFLHCRQILYQLSHKGSPDIYSKNVLVHFAFLHFFFLGMVLITASCTMSQTSIHSSSGTALQIAEKRREVKGKGEKERYTDLNAEFQRIARRDKKAFLTD